MRAVNFDAVESDSLRRARRRGKSGDGRFDIRGVHRPAERPVRSGKARRTQAFDTGDAVAHANQGRIERADVPDLRENRRALGVHGIDDRPPGFLSFFTE